MILKFFDANGVEWNYNTKEEHFYVPLTEEELKRDGMKFEENGYHGYSLDEALIWLEEEGYMERE